MTQNGNRSIGSKVVVAIVVVMVIKFLSKADKKIKLKGFTVASIGQFWSRPCVTNFLLMSRLNFDIAKKHHIPTCFDMVYAPVMWKRKRKLEAEAAIFYGSGSGSGKHEMNGSGSGSSKKILEAEAEAEGIKITSLV